MPKFNGSDNFSFLRLLYLVFEMLLKENYFAADEVKSLICTVFIKADDEISFSLFVRILHNLFLNDFLHGSLIQFFFTKVFFIKIVFYKIIFYKSIRCKSDVFQ